MLESLIDEHCDWFNRASALLNSAHFALGGHEETCFKLCLQVAALYQTAALAVRYDLPGPAYALLRPSIETLLRAIWVQGDQAADEHFRNEPNKIPVLSQLFVHADQKFGGNPPLVASLHEHIKHLHGFTHGGNEMLFIYEDSSSTTASASMTALISDMRRIAAAAMNLAGQVGLAPAELRQLECVLSEAC